MRTAYSAERRARAPARHRTLVVFDKPDLDAIDAWAIPAGQISRSEAIRFLVREGLAATRQKSREASR